MEKVTDTIIHIGVNDHNIHLFEAQYPVPQGMAYNSYVILDEKIAVTDTVEESFAHQWFANLEEALQGRKPDYLIVHHMEGDHSANIQAFMEKYPEAQVVSSLAALNMMKCYFGVDYTPRAIPVREGFVLELGKHALQFIAAPMIHWPEVFMSYDACDKVLFSADAFGTFGANDQEPEEPWETEARRYYYGIVGKFGTFTETLLKKAAGLDIQTICSLHGPVLTGNVSHYVDLYKKWATYTPESDGVFIPYTSIYGHTEKAVQLLAEELKKAGKEVVTMNLAENDVSYALTLAFYYKNIVFATTTYNGGIFPTMEDLLFRLADHNFCKRRVGFVENGSWGPAAAKNMKEKLAACKELEYTDTTVTVKGALNDASVEAVKKLAAELA